MGVGGPGRLLPARAGGREEQGKDQDPAGGEGAYPGGPWDGTAIHVDAIAPLREPMNLAHWGSNIRPAALPQNAECSWRGEAVRTLTGVLRSPAIRHTFEWGCGSASSPPNTTEGNRMRGIDGAARPRLNVWIALPGLLLLGALAFGLLQSGAGAVAPLAAGSYQQPGTGSGNGKVACHQLQGGYQVPCPADASSVSTKPKSPTAGKGFKVSFQSKSGGGYSVIAIHKKKKTTLESGATGAGKTTTKTVGKKLKAGSYTIQVTVTAAGKPDKAKHSITISK